MTIAVREVGPELSSVTYLKGPSQQKYLFNPCSSLRVNEDGGPQNAPQRTQASQPKPKVVPDFQLKVSLFEMRMMGSNYFLFAPRLRA